MPNLRPNLAPSLLISPSRDAVRAVLKNREAALNRVRNAGPNDLERQITEIHSAYHISGIYLMSKEEWGVIGGDLRYRENKYVPQILPKLKNRSFWSASVHPPFDEYAFYFNGVDGYVYDDDRYNGNSVRCVVGG